jgi:hypothetical protein
MTCAYLSPLVQEKLPQILNIKQDPFFAKILGDF